MKKNAAEYNDSDLIRLVSGNRKESAFAMKEIYSRFSGGLYNYILRLLDRSEFAEDVLQNVFVNFYESVQHGNKVNKLKSYLLRIARNLCINENQLKSSKNIHFDELKYKSDNSIDDLDKGVLIDNLNKALENLPLEYREVIVMKDFLDFKYHEIAEILDTTIHVVRIRIYRAKQKLRIQMQDFKNEIKDFNI